MFHEKKAGSGFPLLCVKHEDIGLTRRTLVHAAFCSSILSVDTIRQKASAEEILRAEDDPLLPALARHSTALKAYNKACNIIDDVAAHKTGRKVTAVALEQFRAAEEEASRAFKALIETPPQSFHGMHLFLIYLREMDHDDMKAGLSTVIQSTLWTDIDTARILDPGRMDG